MQGDVAIEDDLPLFKQRYLNPQQRIVTQESAIAVANKTR